MHVVILGAGALGRLYASLLLHSSISSSIHLTLIARGSTFDSISTHGITANLFNSPSITAHPHSLISSLSQLTPNSVDLIILTVKSYHLSSILTNHNLIHYLTPSGTILSLLNGLSPLHLLQSHFNSSNIHILAGVSRVYAEPHPIHNNTVTITNQIHSIQLGPLHKNSTQSALQTVELLNHMDGVSVTYTDDVWNCVWRKIITVVPMGIVGAVTRCSLDIVMRDARELFIDCIQELVYVANNQQDNKVELNQNELVQQVVSIADNATINSTVSLQRDIEAGNISELDAQLGAVIRIAHKYNINAPVLYTIYRALLPEQLAAQERFLEQS